MAVTLKAQVKGLGVNDIEYYEVDVNPGASVPVGDASVDLAVGGAKTTHYASASPLSKLEGGLTFQGCEIPAADTVRVHLRNNTGAPVTAISRKWLVALVKVRG